MPRCSLLRFARAVVIGTTAVLGACADQSTLPTVSAGDPALPAVVGSSSTAPPTVTWLAPLGNGPTDPGTFDATAAPVVEVCAWNGAACAGAPVARFSTIPSGTDQSLIVNAAAGRYEGLWNLMDARFTTRRTYRIRVLQGAAELGALSVDVVRGRWAMTRSDGTLAPLASESVLPLWFTLAPSRTLLVITGPGVTGSPGAGTTTHASGARVEYAFRPLPGYSSVSVLLDGTIAATDSALEMTNDRVLVVTADRVPSVSATARPLVARVEALLRATDPNAARSAAQALRADVAALYVSVGPAEARRQLAEIDELTFDPVRDSAAFRQVTQALEVAGLPEVRATSVAPATRQTGHTSLPGVGSTSSVMSRQTTVIYVNGILTSPTTFASSFAEVQSAVTEVAIATGNTDLSFRPFFNGSWWAAPQSGPFTCLMSVASGLRGAVGKIVKAGACVPGALGPLEVSTQFVAGLIPSAVLPYPTASALADAIEEELDERQNVLIVSHSHGNLLAQQALRALEERLSAAELQCVAVTSVAPPVTVNWPPVSRTGLFANGERTRDILLDLLLPTPGDDRVRSNKTDAADARVAEYFAWVRSPEYVLSPIASVTARAAEQLYILLEDMGLHDVVQSYLHGDRTREHIQSSVLNGLQQVSAACGGGTGLSGDTLLVQPNPASVVEGLTVLLRGEVRNSDNVLQPGRTIVWESQDRAIATVDASTGLVHGVRVGSTVIRASHASLQTNVTVNVVPSANPTSPAGNEGHSFGDPHLQTVDGRRYSFQAVGDYRFSKSSVDGDDFEVQTRFRPVASTASANDGAAARVLGDVVNIFPVSGRFDVIINDETILATNALARELPGGGVLRVAGTVATVSWPDRTLLTVHTNGGVSVLLPYARLGKVEALLGNYDGNTANDLRVRNGAELDAELNGLYGAFRESWYVAYGTSASLFRRAPSVPNPASFPSAIVTLADFDPATVNAARATCRNAGVIHPEVVDECAFDIAVTGDNAWATVAAQFDPARARITVSPAATFLTPGASRTFSAATTGLPNTEVTWTATGGSIATTGPNSMTYTAPTTPGEYTVTARSVQSGAVVSTARVTVRDNTISRGALLSGADVAGRIANVGQIDAWTFTAAAGDYLAISLGETGPISGNFYPRLRLVDPTGKEVSYDDDPSRAQVGISNALAGRYTLLVDSYYEATGSYRLTLIQAPGASVVSAGDQGGPTINGAIHTGSIYLGDIDAWTVNASASDYLFVSVGESAETSGNFYPRLRLLDPTGKEVGYNDDPSRPQIGISATVGGVYTLLIDSYYAATGEYRLTAVKAPGSLTVSAGDQGGPLTNGAIHTGSIYLGDIDAWTVSATTGSYLAISMSETATLSGNFYPRMRVIDPSGRQVGYSDDPVRPQVNVTPTVAGEYTVLVDSYYSATGQYQLTAVQAPGALTVSAGDEGGAMTNGASHDGRISLGDIDAWTITATAGDYLLVSMGESGVTSGNFYPRVRLLDPTGRQVAYADDPAQAQVSVPRAVTGVYTVLIDSYYAATGDYLVTMVRAPGTYTVSPGDQGGVLANAATREGSLYVGDVDTWTFTAAAGGSVTVRVNEVTATYGNFYPRLRVLGPTGTQVAYADGSTSAQVIITPTVDGSYTVVLDSYYAASGTYTLVMTNGVAAMRSSKR